MNGQPYLPFPAAQPNSQQQSNQQFPFPWPQNSQPGFYPPPPPQFTSQPSANGMYFNPNILAALHNQLQTQQNQQSNQWTAQQEQPNNQWPGLGGPG
jgi:hypothetical protein